MPYVYDPLLEDDKNKQDTGEDSPMTGGGETFAGQGGAASPATPSQQKGSNKQGSGFVNLDQYLSANKGSQFGSQLTGKVSDTVGAAKQQLDQSSKDFTDESNKGTTHWNDVGDEFKDIVDHAGGGTTDDQKKRAKAIEGSQYAGPEGYYGTAGANQTQGGIEKAKQQAGALQSEGGRFALLDQYFGRPTYSLGQKTLDNALVSNQAGVPARSQALVNQTNQLSEDAKQTGQGLENLITSNRQASADTAKNAHDYANTALTNFGSDLDKRYADFNTGNDEYNQAMRDAVSNLGQAASTSATGDPYALLGLTNNENLYGLKDFSPYLQDAAQPTESQFATPEEAARYRALGDIASDNFELPIDAAQAGKGGTGRITADTGAVSRAVNARQGQAKTQEADILAQGRAIKDSPDIFSKSPEDRINATMNRLNPILDEFARTYGYRPQITPEMLWGSAVDYNDNNTPPPLVTPPTGRNI